MKYIRMYLMYRKTILAGLISILIYLTMFQPTLIDTIIHSRAYSIVNQVSPETIEMYRELYIKLNSEEGE